MKINYLIILAVVFFSSIGFSAAGGGPNGSAGPYWYIILPSLFVFAYLFRIMWTKIMERYREKSGKKAKIR